MGFRLGLLADSMETSISWENCEICIKAVVDVFNQKIDSLKLQGKIFGR
jgi:hypothetical protein